MERKQHKVIFLDRDGVINKDPASINKYSYVTKWEEFRFLPGAKRAIKKLADAGYAIYVISNQAGIAKGYFTLKALKSITENMLREIEKSRGKITRVFYCPHRDEDNCGCRKPNVGLFEKALKGGDIDFKRTFFIGDKIMDVQAGRAIGCRTILVLCGKESLRNKKNWKLKPDHVKRDLLDAVDWILKKRGKV
ncbi:MAG: HAD family hydrolase [Candidatus Omnitrophota bacterium]|nr:HAD family hydrolase [Candidatus Omnitrophota bacterium]